MTTATSPAKALERIIDKAKILGITEIGHQIDPEKVTAEEVAATEAILRDAIAEFSTAHLSATTSQFAEALGLSRDFRTPAAAE
ncbi:hypothetical protein Q8W25_15745 [Shimia thalassica]|uniref:hypothetical protein n=1 Tax=Shimia thalassica TaxID=1715693 RepID=UPI0027356CAA|nr:hypothetical protein [Shimia thalassica]MDP2495483.1 hypothetical protein [Shimia thalassica]